jgi:glyoxylase I family protein
MLTRNVFAFHHVALSVGDVHRSTDFYKLFGFEERASWTSDDGSLTVNHLLLHDRAVLELFCYRRPKPLPKVHRDNATDLPIIGTKHFALHARDLEQARADLARASVDIVSDIVVGRTGVRYFFVKDPDGILVEVVDDTRAWWRAISG